MIHHLESYEDGYSDGKSETLKKVFEEIEELKERIKINGNLSYRIIETEEGEYVHKHDYILNNIVIEIIDEELTQKLKELETKEHNKKLCILAIGKGLSLKAGGIGLVDKEGKIVSNTERGILENLLNKYIEPKDRK